MKNAVRIVLFLLGLCIIAVAGFFLIPDQFTTSYQRILIKQYDYYQSVKDNDNKLIFIGNSSLSFGFDMDTMEQMSGRTTVVIGNHAGYGISTPIEMSKSGLKRGDVVVIEFVNNNINTCGAELLITGMGKRIDLYRYFIPQIRKEIMYGIPAAIKKNYIYWLLGGYYPKGDYSSASYDDRGNMILVREDPKHLAYPYADAGVDLSPVTIDSEFLQYLKEYVDYCDARGVKVYFTVSPLFDEAILKNVALETAFSDWESELKHQLPAPLISDISNYVFPRDSVWEAHGNATHLNTNGAKMRTEKLYYDLKPYLK